MTDAAGGAATPPIFEATDYRGIVRPKLRELRDARPRGAVSRLAKHVRCHPTFFSQVLAGKANFSVEQALAFCDFVGMRKDEKTFFLDILQRDRASDARTRSFYEERLAQQRSDHAELSTRWRDAKPLDDVQQRRYFQSWLSQAVHMLCRLPGPHSAPTIALQLGVSIPAAKQEIAQLVELGLVTQTGDFIHTDDRFLHLASDSPIVRNFHATWRIKLAALMSEEPTGAAFHYSAATTLSRAAIRDLRTLIKEHLDGYKKLIEGSVDEELYLIAIDFCPLTKGGSDQALA